MELAGRANRKSFERENDSRMRSLKVDIHAFHQGRASKTDVSTGLMHIESLKIGKLR